MEIKMRLIRAQLKKRLGKTNRVIIIKVMNELLSLIIHIFDLILLPITILFAFFFRLMRKRKFESLPFSKSVMFKIGVYPIIDHYYEPMFNPKYLYKSLRLKRNLPGINLNIDGQLKLLNEFKFCEELTSFPIDKSNDEIEFCYKDGPFPPADAEYLYNIIRLFKPGKIIEIGSGHSTLMANNAIKKNIVSDPNYNCKHICIEPYESDWLGKINVEIIKERVEKIDISFFEKLKANDILFIDSSHIIRPQGDVLFEYLEILPILKSGVLVHIHDIFTPEDYPDEWVHNAILWNEQYLLEAFLSCNNDYRIIGATNYLLHYEYEKFIRACPITKLLTEKGEQVGAGSIWLMKN